MLKLVTNLITNIRMIIRQKTLTLAPAIMSLDGFDWKARVLAQNVTCVPLISAVVSKSLIKRTAAPESVIGKASW